MNPAKTIQISKNFCQFDEECVIAVRTCSKTFAFKHTIKDSEARFLFKPRAFDSFYLYEEGWNGAHIVEISEDERNYIVKIFTEFYVPALDEVVMSAGFHILSQIK